MAICFCKHPEPGLVKSRLAKDIGDKKAASVYKILLENILANIAGHGFDVLLYGYPDSHHPILQKYAAKYSLSSHSQHGNNLGEKMWHAIDENLENYLNIVLIGSDCLYTDVNYINQAFELLDDGSNIVLGPSEDGGYALIGANKVDKAIFQDISWSTKDVFQQTKNKLTQLEWKYACLPIVRDLDTIEDYQYFKSHKKFMHLF